MVTEPFLPAEPALADVAAQFEQWRRTRATAHERIPPALWDQAVVLTTMLPHSQVAKRLRLSPTDLKKQCLARQGAVVTDAVSSPPDFIEVTAHELSLAAPNATLIEVERPDGARLRLHYRTAPPPLTTVLQAFLEST